MSTNREARVEIENCTGHYYRFKVHHIYSGQNPEHSEWISLAPGQKGLAFEKVHYWTGFFTVGYDNWVVEAFRETSGPTYPISEVYKSGGGSCTEHILRLEDRDQTTLIKVYDSSVEFISKSKTTKAKFGHYVPPEERESQSYTYLWNFPGK